MSHYQCVDKVITFSVWYETSLHVSISPQTCELFVPWFHFQAEFFILYGLRFDCWYRVKLQLTDSNGEVGEVTQLSFASPPCDSVHVIGPVLPICPTHSKICDTPDSKVHGAHLGPTGPRWAPCWPHELCYLGHSHLLCWVYSWLNHNIIILIEAKNEQPLFSQIFMYWTFFYFIHHEYIFNGIIWTSDSFCDYYGHSYFLTFTRLYCIPMLFVLHSWTICLVYGTSSVWCLSDNSCIMLWSIRNKRVLRIHCINSILSDKISLTMIAITFTFFW